MKLQDFINQSHANGVIYTDSDICDKILRSLPKSFDLIAHTIADNLVITHLISCVVNLRLMNIKIL